MMISAMIRSIRGKLDILICCLIRFGVLTGFSNFWWMRFVRIKIYMKNITIESDKYEL